MTCHMKFHDIASGCKPVSRLDIPTRSWKKRMIDDRKKRGASISDMSDGISDGISDGNLRKVGKIQRSPGLCGGFRTKELIHPRKIFCVNADPRESGTRFHLCVRGGSVEKRL